MRFRAVSRNEDNRAQLPVSMSISAYGEGDPNSIEPRRFVWPFCSAQSLR